MVIEPRKLSPKLAIPPSRFQPSPIATSTAPIVLGSNAAYVEEFLSTQQDLAPKSIKAYRQDLSQFLTWSDDRPWSTIRQRHVAQYAAFLKDDLKLRKNTRRRRLQTLKTFFKWMTRSRYIETDPSLEIGLPAIEEGKSKELSDAEVTQIYQALDCSAFPERNRAIFTALLHGLRASEVVGLNVGDYQDGELVIREAKANSVGEVPVIPTMLPEFDGYLKWLGSLLGRFPEAEDPLFLSLSNRTKKQQRRITYAAIRHLIEWVEKETGIQNLHSHQGRHTFSTDLLIKYNLGEAEAMLLTRHKDPRSFKRYTNRKQKLAAKQKFLQACQQSTDRNFDA